MLTIPCCLHNPTRQLQGFSVLALFGLLMKILINVNNGSDGDICSLPSLRHSQTISTGKRQLLLTTNAG